jgi:MFS family permease
MDRDRDRDRNIKIKIKKTYDSINEIIDFGNYNLKTFQIIGLACLLMTIVGINQSYFYYILIPFQSYYKLTDLNIEFISSLNFLGIVFGNFLVGSISKKISRKYIIIFSLLCNFICHLILSIAKHIFIFCICRFLTCFFVGLYDILIFTILVEYLPVKLRGFTVNIVFMFNFIGSIIFLLFCEIYIPNLEYNPNMTEKSQDFYMAMLQISFILLLAIILCVIFLENSPRNLIVNGDLKKAKKILDYYTNNEITINDLKIIEINLKEKGENKFYQKNNGISSLFQKRILFITIIIMISFFCNSFAYFGVQGVITTILKSRAADSSSFSSNEKNILKVQETPMTIRTLINMNLFECFGNIFGAIICELQWLGRKRSLLLMAFIGVFSALISCGFYKHFEIFIGISLSSINLCQDILQTYTGEIYPTKVRDYAIGLNLGITRIGGVISQFIFLPLTKISIFFGIYFYVICILILILGISFLPPDNRREIDSEIFVSKKDKEKEINKDVIYYEEDNRN